MRKICALIFIIAIASSPKIAGETIDFYFKNMPDKLNPTLSKENRLELIEYNKAKQSDSIANRFGKQAHIILRDTVLQHLVIQNTAATTFEMMLIERNESSNLIGIIRTVCGPVCRSYIRFYDTNWNVSSVQFKMPKALEWLNTDSLRGSNLDGKWVENTLNDNFITLSYSAEKKEIVAKNNILDFLSEADRKEIAPYLSTQPFSYQLVEKKWVKK